jgi:hypothetical protein
MKRYEFKKPTDLSILEESRLKEASFMVNNIASAENSLIGVIGIINKIKRQPTAAANILGQALITGIDSMDPDIEDDRLKTARKQLVIKTLIKYLISYRKSL